MSTVPTKVSFSIGCVNLRLHTIPFTFSADIINPELIFALNQYYYHKYLRSFSESDKDLKIIEGLLFRDSYHKSLRQSFPFYNYETHGFVEDDFGVYQDAQHSYSPISGNSIHFLHSSYLTPVISPTTSSGRQKTEKILENDFNTYSQLLLEKVNA